MSDTLLIKRVAKALMAATKPAGVASTTTEYFERMARAAIKEIRK